MINISTGKVVRVIALAREYGPDNPHLRGYISGLNEDEQISLVALMWIGRETFGPDELDEALETAQMERTAPTEDYLGGMPELANFLEDGMDALGINVAHEEDNLR
ncbi:DUF3775 domain-containing protein [Tropicimonas isoalkanivorans]|uniref:DUF3775 domain-containing protein n=1 Tax=Tropicimonas isoalkanivorans TaxID=441112 RepID=A0A1I1P2K2_9RHOB|nr:DUF3775 domain-containing protein [Tropicimonas isoalkanivorans]SFD01193.1 Protein of unknown function [Tropicimonas isoalkanivorans]